MSMSGESRKPAQGRLLWAGAAIALVCVFGALALSVVREREPFEREVNSSFAAAAASAGDPLGCRKDYVDFYDCTLAVRADAKGPAGTVHFRLWVRDDGCWTAHATVPAAAARRFRPFDGCIS